MDNATDSHFYPGIGGDLHRHGRVGAVSLPWSTHARPLLPVIAVTAGGRATGVLLPTRPGRDAGGGFSGGGGSLVARLRRGEEVGGSGPATPTPVEAGGRG